MKHLLTFAVLLSTMLGLFGAAPPVISGRGSPNALLTGTTGQLYVDITTGILYVKSLTSDTSWRRSSASTNQTSFGTNEFVNGGIIAYNYNALGDYTTVAGNFVVGDGGEFRIGNLNYSGLVAIAGVPAAGLAFTVNGVETLFLGPNTLYGGTNMWLGGATRPFGGLYSQSLNVSLGGAFATPTFTVSLGGVITVIENQSVSPLTVTWTNMVPGVITNRMSTIGGILVTHTPIYY